MFRYCGASSVVENRRWTSVDPLTASATIRNPQTFNRYTYALNSPYKFTDPLGLEAIRFRFGSAPDAYGCGAENSSCSDTWSGGGFLELGPKGEADPAIGKKKIEPAPATPAASGGPQQEAEQPQTPPDGYFETTRTLKTTIWTAINQSKLWSLLLP